MSDKTKDSRRQKVEMKQVIRSEHKKKLGARVQNSVAPQTWRLAFVHARSNTLILNGLRLLFVVSRYRRYFYVNRK
jgi:hypothetical protein